MNLSKKSLFLPLALSILVVAPASAKKPEFVSDLWTNKQTAIVAVVSTAFFGACAWAISQDINDEIAFEEKTYNKTIKVNPFKKYALITVPSAICAGFIAATMHVGISLDNLDQYLAQANEAYAKNAQEIIFGSGI